MSIYSRNFGYSLPRVVSQVSQDDFSPTAASGRSMVGLTPLVGTTQTTVKTVRTPTAAEIAAANATEISRQVAAALAESERLRKEAEAQAKAQLYDDGDASWMNQELVTGVANKWLLVGGGVLVLALGGFMFTKKRSSVAGYRRRKSRR